MARSGLTALQARQLHDDGFLLLPNRLPRGRIATLRARLERLWSSEGARAGAENYIEDGVRRLANLRTRGARSGRSIEIR